MDTIGAVLGPLCATALIGIVGMRGVLLWSLAPGLAAAVAFAALAPSSKERRIAPRAKLAQKLPRPPNKFLAFPRWRLRPRHRRLRPHAPDSSRLPNSRPARRRRTRRRNLSWPLHLLQCHERSRILSSRRSRRSHRQTRPARRRLPRRHNHLRRLHPRAAHSARPHRSLRPRRHSLRRAAIPRKIPRRRIPSPTHSRLRLRRPSHSQRHRRPRLQHRSRRTLVSRKPRRRLPLRRHLHRHRRRPHLFLHTPAHSEIRCTRSSSKADSCFCFAVCKKRVNAAVVVGRPFRGDIKQNKKPGL